MKKIISGILILNLSLILTGQAQFPDAKDILQRVKINYERVEDYTATLTAKVDMERLKIPEMKIKLYFKRPDKIHIESGNFAMLPREGVALNPGHLIEKFEGNVISTETKDGIKLYKIHLLAKEEKAKYRAEMNIWVDASRWVITKLESNPAEVRKVSVDFEYVTIENKYILPSKITAGFDTPQSADTTSERPLRSSRMPRKGNVVIAYEYEYVNSGLPDSIFEKKEEKK